MKRIKELFFSTQEENFSEWQLFLLSILGPMSLLIGLSCLLFKYAHHLWPMIFAASCGFFFIWKWKKIAFALSLIFLSLAFLSIIRTQDALWPSLYYSSIALSWLLFLLGQAEAKAWIDAREKTLNSLKEDNTALLNDLEKFETIAARDHNEMANHLERLKKELHDMQLHLSSLNSKLECEEKEKENWKAKADHLTIEISSYQRKENAFQHALEDAQSQLFKLRQAHAQLLEQQAALCLQQEMDPVEEKSLHALQVQHAQLKIQFDEKSEVLHQTRKELFAIEGALLTLQKETEENASSMSHDDTAQILYIEQLQKQCCDLEDEVLMLEELITLSLQSKKNPSPRKKKNAKQAQEDLFLMVQEKLSQA